MNASELHEHSFRLGSQYLEPAGFEYQNKNWLYLGEDFHLSFVLGGKNKYSNAFQEKWLTVPLIHDWVRVGEGKLQPEKYQNRDRWCAVQISPMVLPGFVQSGFDPGVWHYLNLSKHHEHPSCYELLHYNADPKALETLEQAITWARHMTPKRIVEQIKEYGDDWWTEQGWLEAYEEDRAQGA